MYQLCSSEGDQLMPSLNLMELPEQFPGWPSGDRIEIAQLRLPLEIICERLKEYLPPHIEVKLHRDDARDGLGPYAGFHVKDPVVGLIAFVQYSKSPFKGTTVLVDSRTSASIAMERLRNIIQLKESEIEWLHPDVETDSSKLVEQVLALVDPFRLHDPDYPVRMQTFLQLGFDHWRRSIDLAKMEKSDEQLHQLKKAVELTLDAYRVWEQSTTQHPSNETHLIFAHQAMSNVLYYAIEIKQLFPSDPYVSVQHIRQWISQSLVVEEFGKRNSLTMRHNLMRAYSIVGDSDKSRELADDIVKVLKSAAEKRAGQFLEIGSVANHLANEEILAFLSAVKFAE